MREKLFAPARDPLWSAVAAVLASLLVSFIAIAATGRDPLAGFGNLAAGALAGPGPWGEPATKSAVLSLCGLSVAVAFTVGLFNIGAEGQLIWGGLAAAAAGRIDTPLALPLSLAAAVLAGGAWGLVPGILTVRRGGHQVLSTILFTSFAIP